MPAVSEDAVRALLRARGAAEHVVREGGAGLVSRWRRFVAEAERGYAMGIEEYRNDLDVRTLIAASGLAGEVEPEDKRLRALLVNTRQPVWQSDAPDAFWVCGYPANAAGDLLADLRAAGLYPADRCAR